VKIRDLCRLLIASADEKRCFPSPNNALVAPLVFATMDRRVRRGMAQVKQRVIAYSTAESLARRL
jgi:hypothetical protein